MNGTVTLFCNWDRGVRLVAFAAFLLFLAPATWASAGAAVPLKTEHNRPAIAAIERELNEHRNNVHYCSVLRGLRWCVMLVDDLSVFEIRFSSYITMLNELSQPPAPPALRKIVHTLIRREFSRALPRLGNVFPPDSRGYMDFVSVLPVAYRHKVPIGGLKRFAETHFSGVEVRDRLEEFREAARKFEYVILTDIVVQAAFVDMAYELGADRDFRLPPNRYRTIIDECAAIPFVHRYGDGGYYDQNYYATHIVLALNHFGGRRLGNTAAGDNVFAYLSENYDLVRSKVKDMDLLCEYLYCLRQFGMSGPLVSEGEQHIVSLQHADGSWGMHGDCDGQSFDQLHPTWTAITLLVLGVVR